MTHKNAYGFILEKSHPIKGLDLTVQVYTHESGFKHIHLAKEDPELAFTIAFPTHPENNTGVAHALEHMVLCGSKKFPVRDPFFNMLRRSLATFANAFTTPDHTRYPFSTTDIQDYWNLMDVYLDAVFFPELNSLDFDQEAVRLVLSENGEPAGFDGVVFNEMLGARSNSLAFIPTILAQAIAPNSIYANDFGGAPESIPDLTIDDLKQFHSKHYHPSVALLTTYGSVDPEEIQKRFNEKIFDQKIVWPVAAASTPMVSSWPENVSTSIPQEENAEYLWIKLWELPCSKPEEELHSSLMASLLLEEGQAIPVSLDNLGFGQRLAVGITKVGDQMVMMVAVGHLQEDQIPLVESTVNQAIAAQQAEGVSQALIDASLESLETHQRTIDRKNGLSPGLSFMEGIIQDWAQRGEATPESIDLDLAISKLPGLPTPASFIEWASKVSELRSTTIKCEPDLGYFERRRKQLEEDARQREASLSADERQNIITRAEALLKRQRAEQDANTLPILALSQIDPKPQPSAPISFIKGENEASVALIQTPLNGLVDISIVFDLSGIDTSKLHHLVIFTDVWNQMRVGERSWEQSEQWRSQLSGNMKAQLGFRNSPDNDNVHLELSFSTSCLERNAEKMLQALQESILTTRMDDTQRLTFLVGQAMKRRERSLGKIGQGAAAKLASAWLNPSRALADKIEGPSSLSFMSELYSLLSNAETAGQVSQQMRELSSWIIQQPCIIRGCDNNPENIYEAIKKSTHTFPRGWDGLVLKGVNIEVNSEPAHTVFVGPTDLANTFQTMQGPPIGHPDEAAMQIAAELISKQYLHSAIREQGGAYGGGMAMGEASLIFYSNRDPRLSETFQDFDRAYEWISQAEITPTMLHEAILSRFSSISIPDTPMDLAVKSWERAMLKIEDEKRHQLRQSFLELDVETIRQTAKKWLAPDLPKARTAFIGYNMVEEAKTLQFNIEEIKSLLGNVSSNKHHIKP